MTHSLPRRAIAGIAAAAAITIALIQAALLVLRPEAGPLGVLQALAPDLALVGLVMIPVALIAATRRTVVACLALVLVTTLRFGGEWLSLPPATLAAATARLALVTWNVEIDARPGTDTAALIQSHPADIVALQELQPDAAAAIAADPALSERYPYRILVPRDDVGGMGLLSRYPIRDPTFQLFPIVQSASVDLGHGRQLAVINAHPFHAEIAKAGRHGPPIGLDPSRRNADLVAIRAMIDAKAAAGLPVALLGDLNTASSEPAFDRFVAGLRDVHREIGLGPGWTWRPIRLEFLGFGLVAIDHVIVTPDLTPQSITVACPDIGDHCLVDATVARPG